MKKKMKLPPKGKACGSVALNVVSFPDHLQNVTHWVGVTSHELCTTHLC